MNAYIDKVKKESNRKVALFLDNCRVHHAKEVTAHFEKLKIPTVFNLAYQPAFMGQESVWAAQKRTFRKELTKAKIEKRLVDVRQLVERIQAEM